MWADAWSELDMTSLVPGRNPGQNRNDLTDAAAERGDYRIAAFRSSWRNPLTSVVVSKERTEIAMRKDFPNLWTAAADPGFKAAAAHMG
jgi:hypothetical protein